MTWRDTVEDIFRDIQDHESVYHLLREALQYAHELDRDLYARRLLNLIHFATSLSCSTAVLEKPSPPKKIDADAIKVTGPAAAAEQADEDDVVTEEQSKRDDERQQSGYSSHEVDAEEESEIDIEEDDNNPRQPPQHPLSHTNPHAEQEEEEDANDDSVLGRGQKDHPGDTERERGGSRGGQKERKEGGSGGSHDAEQDVLPTKFRRRMRIDDNEEEDVTSGREDEETDSRTAGNGSRPAANGSSSAGNSHDDDEDEEADRLFGEPQSGAKTQASTSQHVGRGREGGNGGTGRSGIGGVPERVTVRTIENLKKQLIDAFRTTEDDKVLKILAALARQKMTVELMATTGIGRAVKTIKDSCNNPSIASSAKQLVRAWKKIVEDRASASPAPSPAVPITTTTSLPPSGSARSSSLSSPAPSSSNQPHQPANGQAPEDRRSTPVPGPSAPQSSAADTKLASTKARLANSYEQLKHEKSKRTVQVMDDPITNKSKRPRVAPR